MYYPKFSLSIALAGLLTAGCQKENTSPISPTDSYNVTSSPGRPKGTNNGRNTNNANAKKKNSDPNRKLFTQKNGFAYRNKAHKIVGIKYSRQLEITSIGTNLKMSFWDTTDRLLSEVEVHLFSDKDNYSVAVGSPDQRTRYSEGAVRNIPKITGSLYRDNTWGDHNPDNPDSDSNIDPALVNYPHKDKIEKILDYECRVFGLLPLKITTED